MCRPFKVHNAIIPNVNSESTPGVVRIKVIRNGSPPLAIAQPALLSLHSDILAILISIYSADQILDPRQHSSNQVKPSIHIQTQQSQWENHVLIEYISDVNKINRFNHL